MGKIVLRFFLGQLRAYDFSRAIADTVLLLYLTGMSAATGVSVSHLRIADLELLHQHNRRKSPRSLITP